MAEEKTEKTLDASHSFAESDNNEKGISTAAPSNDEPILVSDPCIIFPHPVTMYVLKTSLR